MPQVAEDAWDQVRGASLALVKPLPPIKPDSSLPWGPPAGPHGGSIVLTAPAACTSATPLRSSLQVSPETLGRRRSLGQREATVWFQAHEMYSKQRSALCMPGLGWTVFLNLITPFRRRERNTLPFTLGEVATYVSLLGTEPRCQKGPCAHTRTHGRWGRQQEVLEGAGGAVSDETGKQLQTKHVQMLPCPGGHLSLAGCLWAGRAWPPRPSPREGGGLDGSHS